MPVRVDKQTFIFMVTQAVKIMDAKAYAQFSDIVLTALGVQDAEGNLAKEYKDSKMWVGGENGEPLRVSEYAKSAAKTTLEISQTIKDMVARNKAAKENEQ